MLCTNSIWPLVGYQKTPNILVYLQEYHVSNLQPAKDRMQIKVLSTSNVFYLYFFFSINSSFVKFNVNFLSKVNSQQKNTISFLIHVHVHRYNFLYTVYVNIHTLMNLISIYTHELTWSRDKSIKNCKVVLIISVLLQSFFWSCTWGKI